MHCFSGRLDSNGFAGTSFREGSVSTHRCTIQVALTIADVFYKGIYMCDENWARGLQSQKT